MSQMKESVGQENWRRNRQQREKVVSPPTFKVDRALPLEPLRLLVNLAATGY